MAKIYEITVPKVDLGMSGELLTVNASLNNIF